MKNKKNSDILSKDMVKVEFSQDELKILFNILNSLDYKLGDAKKVLVISQKVLDKIIIEKPEPVKPVELVKPEPLKVEDLKN